MCVNAIASNNISSSSMFSVTHEYSKEDDNFMASAARYISRQRSEAVGLLEIDTISVTKLCNFLKSSIRLFDKNNVLNRAKNRTFI